MHQSVLSRSTSVIPEAPSHIVGPALERWNAVWLEVDRTRVTLKHVDSVALYCQAFATFTSASEAVNPFGPVVAKDKRAQVSPYLAVRDNSMRVMMELGKTLGLSPDTVQVPLACWEDYAMVIADDEENSRGHGAVRAD